jgi:copper homeostasis protein CutC
MLEVCVDTLDGIDAAVRGGADRIELCAALTVGGLTPPQSLIRAAAAAPIPVHLLARPRDGGFVYTPAEQALIADDIRTAAEAELAGVVIGALRTDRRLDTDLLARLAAHARALGDARGAPLSLTLHRAFDLAADLPAALDTAIALGFDRILTSGGAPRAIDGRTMLATLGRRAAGRIVILAGSGVTPDTLPAILATEVREVHASCRTALAPSPPSDEIRFGFVAGAPTITDETIVSRLSTMMRASIALHDTNI